MERLCSNALAMFKKLVPGQVVGSHHHDDRKLMEMVEAEDGGKWPAWMSEEDRRLLVSDSVTANVVVDANGGGNYKTVSEAVAAAPSGSSRYVIRIKSGTYRENVEVTKKNIMFMGDSRTNTIITASKNYVDDGSTFNSGTVSKFFFHFSTSSVSIYFLS